MRDGQEVSAQGRKNISALLLRQMKNGLGEPGTSEEMKRSGENAAFFARLNHALNE